MEASGKGIDSRKFWHSYEEISTQAVSETTAEWKALALYFDGKVPEDCKLQSIQRVENPTLWALYDTHLQAVNEGFPGQAEMWLWHGADDVRQIIEGGFKTAYSNRTFNVYGVGHYFAVDPRMANHFVRARRDMPGSVKDILLCRVAAGICKTKDPIKLHVDNCHTKTMACKFWACRELRAKLLRMPEN